MYQRAGETATDPSRWSEELPGVERLAWYFPSTAATYALAHAAAEMPIDGSILSATSVSEIQGRDTKLTRRPRGISTDARGRSPRARRSPSRWRGGRTSAHV